MDLKNHSALKPSEANINRTEGSSQISEAENEEGQKGKYQKRKNASTVSYFYFALKGVRRGLQERNRLNKKTTVD